MRVGVEEFKEIQRLVRSLCGLVLNDDKTYLVETRLESIVRSHRCQSFGEYLARLRTSHEAGLRDELVECLTTGETSFNRDPHVFDEIRKHLIPKLADRLRDRKSAGYSNPLCRIWSAGCSTGQEPYSLSMAILDYLAANPRLGIRPEQFPILATDVSQKSLQVAREGHYPSRDMDRGVTPEQRLRYFQPDGENWRVQDALKSMIEFRRLNFLDPIQNMGPFDLICCRNVMIYFDNEVRQKLCEQFHRLLNPGGWLLLGTAESLYGLPTSLEPMSLGTMAVYSRPVK